MSERFIVVEKDGEWWVWDSQKSKKLWNYRQHKERAVKSANGMNTLKHPDVAIRLSYETDIAKIDDILDRVLE